MSKIKPIDKIAVSPTEAAELLGVSRTTIYQLMGRKNFPCIRLSGPGGRVLIHVKKLSDWLIAQTEEAQTHADF